jgi:tetratricopeptide (TPR) repeat protein
MAMGQRCMAKQDYNRAILEFRNATQIAPASAEAHYQLGLALLAGGDQSDGVQHLLKCTELNPRHAQAQAKLAQLMATSRNPDNLKEARRRAAVALDADPNAVASLDAMAVLDWNRENPEVSEQHLELALQRVPNHLHSAVMLANVKLITKDYAGAEDVLKKAADNSAESAEIRIALGGLYRLLKRLDAAGGRAVPGGPPD